jgi:DNA segregation ATPase FtsK/SpoIIIE, S-DNA-T family
MASNTLENKQLFKTIPEIELHPTKLGRAELKGIIWFACSIFFLICLASYDPKDCSFNVVTSRLETHNLCGLIGSHIADALGQLVGVCSLAIPIFFFFMGVRCFSALNGRSQSFLDYLSFVILILVVCSVLDRFSNLNVLNLSPAHPGGAVGSLVGSVLTKFFGRAGSLVVSLTILLICGLELSKGSLLKLIKFCFPSAKSLDLANLCLREKCGSFTRGVFAMVRSSINMRRIEKSNTIVSISTSENNFSSVSPITDPLEKDDLGIYGWERLSFLPDDEIIVPFEQRQSERPLAIPVEKSLECEEDQNPIKREHSPVPWKSIEFSGSYPDPETEDDSQGFSTSIPEKSVEFNPSHDLNQPVESLDNRSIKVTKRADAEIVPVQGYDSSYSVESDYRLPPIDLLDIPEISKRFVDEKLLETNASILEQKLGDLGIKGQVVEIHPGPVITMYEITLAPGIPLRRVLNTADDLAMALKSGSTRVVAPIPGKDTVGIEVPNLYREIVYFREIIESSAYKSISSPLKMALGKCIDGEPFATSLARMPHLLIAGATGTGKSVGLNSLICSWLMSYSPDEVNFIMVDPKKLELSYYQDIPHLIYPVVTDPDKVPKVLNWAIREMERRYELLSQAGAKNIEGYNQQVMAGVLTTSEEENSPKKLPYIIIIVDELAELMMVAAKDIEISIARLAQMARAAGIHLILATQRPSVDVITGIIKANLPARISFQVSAKPDSRTIIDTVGAENLLGMGDMLFLPPGTSKLLRLHGAFVSENEIRRIADFTKSQRSPVYLSEISNIVDGSDGGSISGSDSIEDEKYDEAVALVTRIGHASISLIQRHMRIGYNRAARIIETMEAQRLIGPSDGTSRPREVYALSLDHIPDRDQTFV